jgi:cytoskeletal protein CcmA (bactofilin family)
MFSRRQSSGATRSRPAKAGAAGLSLIGPEMTISGDVRSEGALHVEGRIEGRVQCRQLCQSESGVITGDIHAEEARIGGLAEGGVNAGIVAIEASGRVAGDVAYDTISIAAGAEVEGRLARREALAGGSADLLVATSTVRKENETADGALFSGRPTRIAVD